jgi:hypothetical protein
MLIRDGDEIGARRSRGRRISASLPSTGATAGHGGTGFRIAVEALYCGSIVNNRKEVIQCLIVYRRGRRQS